MIRAKNPKTGTVRVKLRFTGRRKPSVCEDPWAEENEMSDMHCLMYNGDNRYPVSRDYREILCGRVTCEWNISKFCSVPSLCVIGEDGKCEGYEVKGSIKEQKPLDGD